MNIVKRCILSVFLCGCTSSYNNNTDGANPFGGGFSDYKVYDGLYSVVAKTNFAPWTDFAAAHDTFNRRATELCQSNSFKTIKVREGQYEHVYTGGAIKYIISQVDGYVICEPLVLFDDEAESLIRDYESDLEVSWLYINPQNGRQN